MLKLARILLSDKFLIAKHCFASMSSETNSSHIETSDPIVLETMKKFMIVKEDFLSESEENSLLSEVQPYMKRLRYEFDHWDNVIYFFFKANFFV